MVEQDTGDRSCRTERGVAMGMTRTLLAVPIAAGLCVGCASSSDTAKDQTPATTTSVASSVVDVKSIERRIVAELTGPDPDGDPAALKDLAVTCPENVQAQKGTTFR